MRTSKQPKTVLIGAGKIATHLGHRLLASGIPVVQVVSRSGASAQKLADSLGCDWTTDTEQALPAADWYIIAVKDDAIPAVAAALSSRIGSGLVVHTSGATPGTVLRPFFQHSGVFYPLQTFSLEKKPLWSKIPLCVDAVADEDLHFLEKMAHKIGAKPQHITDTQRAQLHVAAVFANNFSNHCLAVAEQLLLSQGLPFALLHPLVEATLSKALSGSPALAQTGPALRGDMATMEQHQHLLEGHEQWQAIYRTLSDSIQNTAF